MSLDIAILELSKQIIRLQSELDLLRGDQKDIQPTCSISPETKKRKLKASKAKSKLSILLYRMQQEHYEMLCQKYKDEIAFIQKRDPGWMPPKRFFDI